MNAIIIQLIHSFNGYVVESAGSLNGFFDDPASTRTCADLIRRQVDTDIQVCGCGLTIPL